MAYLTVTVAGVNRSAYLCAPSSGEAATFEEALRERKRFTCEFLDPAGAWVPQRGEGISVTHSILGVIFGGYINTVTRRASPGSDAIFSKVTCGAYEQIMDRRLCGERTWTNTLAGDIFDDIIADSMVGEDFTTEAEAGPLIPLFEVQQPRPTVRQALDRLAELASSGSDIYYWDSSATKVARFFKQDTYSAPISISDANPYVLESQEASVDETNQGLVNRVFVYLGQFLRDEDTQNFVGDSSTRSFELDYPVGAEPTITVDTGGGPVTQTLGIEGVDTGKQFYWQVGSKIVRQDSGETVLDSGDTLAVTYRGLDRRATAPFDDADSASAEGVLQGDGTGVYEAMLTIDTPATLSDAETLAQAWLDRYSVATVTFKGSTFTEGIRAGQEISINLSRLDIDLTMLVQSITMADVGAGHFLWTFTAIYGPARDDWKRALRGETGSASVGGVGGVGPQGPPGASGTGTPAPNVTATGDVYYVPWANSQQFGFSGVITLPTGDPDYAELNEILVYAVDPNDQWHEIAYFNEWSGSTLAYAGLVDEQPSSNQAGWYIKFVARNTSGAPTDSPYTIGPITVEAASLSSVTGSEVGPQYQDENQGLHTVIELTPVVANSQLPMEVTFWVDSNDGRGDVWQGWRTAETVGQAFRFGEGSMQEPGTIWSPTNPDNGTWTVTAAAGAINEGADVPAGAVTDTFAVQPVAAAAADDVTGAEFVNDPDTGAPIDYTRNAAGEYTWHFYKVRWTIPSIVTRPHFWASFITVQKVNSSGTPAPDREGANEDSTGVYLGRRVTDSQAPINVASVVEYLGTTWPDWTYPPNINDNGTTNTYRTFRFRIYSISRRATEESGGSNAVILNNCWPGGADHYDLTPAAHPESLDANAINPVTLGDGIDKDTGLLVAALGDGMKFSFAGDIVPDTGVGLKVQTGKLVFDSGNGLTASGNAIQVSLGSGLTFSGGNVQADLGNGVQFNGSKIELKLAGGLSFNGGSVQVATGNGLTLSGGNLVANLGNGLTISGAAIAVNSGNGLQISGGALTVNLGNGLSLSGSAMQVNATNGLNFTSGALQVNTGAGVSIISLQLAIPSNGVTSAMINSLDVSKLNAGTITVSATGVGITINATGVNNKTQYFAGGHAVYNSSNIATIVDVNIDGAGWGGAVGVYDYLGNARAAIIGYSGGYGLFVDNVKVVGPRGTDPGAPSFSTVSDAQTWCSNLRTELRNHGLI